MNLEGELILLQRLCYDITCQKCEETRNEAPQQSQANLFYMILAYLVWNLTFLSYQLEYGRYRKGYPGGLGYGGVSFIEYHPRGLSFRLAAGMIWGFRFWSKGSSGICIVGFYFYLFLKGGWYGVLSRSLGGLPGMYRSL